jgi:eukaryotic-like serine/threonine-protein kinase
MRLSSSTDAQLTVPSPDGTLFATLQEDIQDICIWDAKTGTCCSTLSPPQELFGAFTSLAWSPGNSSVAAGTKLGQVFLWNIGTGMLTSVSRWQYGPTTSVSWSPDGATLASASGDGRLYVWTGCSEEAARLLCHVRGNEPFEVAWSPDGRLIASCWRDGRVRLWNAHTGRCVFTYRGHTSAVRSCAWSPDGTRIASAGEDDTVQVWRVPIVGHWWCAFRGLWNTRLFHLLPRSSCDSPVELVRWSPDGRVIAAMSEDTLCVWNATDTTRLATFPRQTLHAFSWVRGGISLLTTNDQVGRCPSCNGTLFLPLTYSYDEK